MNVWYGNGSGGEKKECACVTFDFAQKRFLLFYERKIQRIFSDVKSIFIIGFIQRNAFKI